MRSSHQYSTQATVQHEALTLVFSLTLHGLRTETLLTATHCLTRCVVLLSIFHHSSGNTEDYVAWNWKAGGTGVSNTDGSVTSTVSVNQDAGISVVKGNVGSSGNITIGHGLGVSPSFVIAKSLGATSVNALIPSVMTKDNYIFLSRTDAMASYTDYWGSALPTSTVIGLQAGIGFINDTIIYAFAEVEGFSSFGSYTGNGSADGPFIYTGFRPAWFMLKKTSGTGWWYVFDAERNTYNLTGKAVFPNSSAAETDYPGGASLGMDFLSNGVKLRGYQTEQNGSGTTYIYMAFAEMPFKYSVGR